MVPLTEVIADVLGRPLLPMRCSGSTAPLLDQVGRSFRSCARLRPPSLPTLAIALAEAILRMRAGRAARISPRDLMANTGGLACWTRASAKVDIPQMGLFG